MIIGEVNFVAMPAHLFDNKHKTKPTKPTEQETKQHSKFTIGEVNFVSMPARLFNKKRNKK